MDENNVNNQEGRLYIVGTRGYSAYEVAVLNGYEGTEEEWLDSLVGPQGETGPQGKSAYQVAVDNGYQGTEEEWSNSFLTPDGYVPRVDIVDNLTSEATNKPLSGKQGKVLKTLVDENKSDIEEINDNLESLETTLSGNISSEITNRQQADTDLQSQIDALANGSPLVASNTSEMTDTTKVYVNTTDGHWYYYDGDSWEDGGVYQSTGINNNSISPAKTTFYNIKNIIPLSNWIIGKVYYATDGVLRVFNDGICSYNPTKVDVTPDSIMVVHSYAGTIDLKFHFWDNENTYLSSVSIINNDLSYVTVPSNASYMTFSLYKISIFNLPENVYGCLFDDYFNEINHQNAEIKNNCFNTLDTSQILLYDNITIINKLCNKNLYDFDSFKFSIYNNVVSLKGPLASTSEQTRYSGIFFKPKNYNVGDVMKIKSNIGKSTSIYSGTIQGSLSTTTSFGRLDFSTDSINDFTITQSAYDFLQADENNCFVIGYSILPGESTINANFEFGGRQGRTLKEYIDENITEKTLKIIALGDSITALTGSRSWLTYFNQIQPINIIYNTAVNGAWLNDKVGTVYDGNPVFNGPDNNVNNVLGNQVQKILNNDYTTPDIIMIAIGTNSGISCSEQDIYNSYYDSSGTLIPLNNVDRTTSAGAFRYCNETLRNKYPNATIFWCAPIQGFNSIRNLNNIIEWGKNLENLCKYSSVQFINTEDCGITGYTEKNGQQGLYLADGLHPNSNGAKYMGYYNATKVKEYYESCKLLNE